MSKVHKKTTRAKKVTKRSKEALINAAMRSFAA
jgi:hypothetical protein